MATATGAAGAAPTRRAGIPQGLIIVTTAFLPILAIVSLTVAVPTIIDHFKADPNAGLKAPVIVSAPGLTIALLAMFVGVLVDRFGRRRLLVGATALYALFGVAPFFLDDLNAIIGSRLVLGVSEAFILTIVNTLIADYWDHEGRRRWLTFQGLAGPFFASGVIRLSGPLTELRWNGIFLVYLIALPIFLAMLAWIYEPSRNEAAPAPNPMGGPTSAGFPWVTVATFGVVTLFASSLYYVFIINGGMAFREVGITSPDVLSTLIFWASLFVMAGALIFWLLAKRAPAFQLAVFLGLIGAGLAGIGLARDTQSMFLSLVIQQTGAGMAVPTLIAWAQSKLPFEHRGRGMGVWTSAFFLGQFSSPFLVNLGKHATGTMQGAFVVAGAAGLVGGLVAVVCAFRRAPLTHPVTA